MVAEPPGSEEAAQKAGVSVSALNFSFIKIPIPGCPGILYCRYIRKDAGQIYIQWIGSIYEIAWKR